MSDFIIGGWTQKLTNQPPNGFSYTMYGMITNLSGLTSGTVNNPGWSPTQETAPAANSSSVLWTYGGGLCSPNAMPSSQDEIDQIVECTIDKQWQGVDVDDECNMDINNIVTMMQQLKSRNANLTTSYTFLAGWDYNNPAASQHGQAINNSVTQIANADAADRYILMCYASAMWSQTDIENNVAAAIDRTINTNGVPKKKVILALTPRGLDDWNLDYFLDQVINFDIGGLFIWDFTSLSSSDLNTIETRLGIQVQS